MKFFSLLHKLLTSKNVKISSIQFKFWFSLSLALGATFSIYGLWIALSSEYVVQDDARQHIFWMQRFSDPELFPNDLIADYFQSVAPWGFSFLYWLMAKIGIEPLVFNKLLPTVLALFTTGYCFGLCLEILPVPFAAFLATLLLNQNLWLVDDLVSGTPTAFIYPLFLAFLYYLLRRSWLPCLVVIVLQGLFYPPCVLLSAGTLFLQLLGWRRWLPRFCQSQRDYRFCAAGLGVAILVMLPYVLSSSNFGPVVTAAQARNLPEFLPGTGTVVFVDDPIEFWFCWMRSGLFPSEWCRLTRQSWEQLIPLMPPQIWAGLSLPVLLCYPSRFPLVREVRKSGVVLLAQVILVSLGLFLAAHALLFKLYLPSRYTEHSLRIVLPIAAGLTLAVILEAAFHWSQRRRTKIRQFLALKSTTLLVSVLLLYLVMYPAFLRLNKIPFPRFQYIVGHEKPIYEFFSQQPKNILIASLSSAQTVLPTFSKRSVLLGGEVLAPPYHRGYYAQIAKRASDVIKAQYSPNLVEVQQVIQKYEIDFWLLDRGAFTPKYLSSNPSLRQFKPATTEALRKLEQGAVPVLSKLGKGCSVLETKNLIVLQADCITKISQQS